MNTDHYRINVALPQVTARDTGRYKHHFYATVDAVGVEQEQQARMIARELQTLYPTAKISITLWESRGQEVAL